VNNKKGDEGHLLARILIKKIAKRGRRIMKVKGHKNHLI
jgi:hypothetical protein